MKRAIAIALVSLTGLTACQLPPEPTGAEEVYRDTCQSCHGGHYQRTALLDLSGLAAANGGEFPMELVLRTIDGRDGARAHGSPMPVWGEVYSPELVQDLANYLASIQQ